MNVVLSGAIKRSALAAGWYRRRLAHDAFPGVAVLCYHGVRADDLPDGAMPLEQLHVRAHELAAHCEVVRATCHPISLDDWRAALAETRPLPERPVLFTFDDGYRSVFTIARPLLERYEIPATVFICTEPARRRQTFWYDTLAREGGNEAVERAKATPESGWTALIAGASLPVADDHPCAPIKPDEVAELAARPLFEIGSHSASHPILAALGAERQRGEIQSSVSELERWTGQPVRAFAYPNGRPRLDFTPQTRALVADCGVDFAFTTVPGFAAGGVDPLECPRFIMLSDVSGAELAHRLAYSWRT